MNDMELLEMAAKAAGYKVRWHDVWNCFVHVVPINTQNPPTVSGLRHVWVPLDDDGDALRLDVRLHLDLRFHWDGCHDQYDEVEAYTHGAGRDASEQIGLDDRGYQIDELNATRRAIVSAAAAIGKGMLERDGRNRDGSR